MPDSLLSLRSRMGAGRPVFMMTRLENLSAASFTTLRPVRPPQSWHTSVMSLQGSTFNLLYYSGVLDRWQSKMLKLHLT